ncbi:unnamed protein product, partial [Prorocentrum cordatum]
DHLKKHKTWLWRYGRPPPEPGAPPGESAPAVAAPPPPERTPERTQDASAKRVAPQVTKALDMIARAEEARSTRAAVAKWRLLEYRDALTAQERRQLVDALGVTRVNDISGTEALKAVFSDEVYRWICDVGDKDWTWREPTFSWLSGFYWHPESHELPAAMEMRGAIANLKRSNSDAQVIQTCLETLRKIGENACQHWNPTTKKHLRTIQGGSSALKKKIFDVPGGLQCFLALGFTQAAAEGDGEPAWIIAQNVQAIEDKCWEGYAVLREELMSGSSIPVDEAKSKAANEGGGIEGTIRDMLTSPAKLNQLLRNPMVRQMVSANPDVVERFASAMPEVRETLTIYPEMRRQLESVIGRPLRLEEPQPLAGAPPAAPAGGGGPAFAAAAAPASARTVQAYVYDITQGMAKGMSQMLVGKQIDLVPHTGIVVFGREYFFGGGPSISDNPGKSVPVPVAQTIVLGETDKTREELEAYISGVLALEHNEQNYNLLNHNCNHYADAVARFLLEGRGIPDHIVNFGQDALSTPQGQQLRTMIEGMERDMRRGGGGSGMNPFGSGAPQPAPPPGHEDVASQLMAMGFPPDRCREVAARSGGDVVAAVAMLTSD